MLNGLIRATDYWTIIKNYHFPQFNSHTLITYLQQYDCAKLHYSMYAYLIYWLYALVLFLLGLLSILLCILTLSNWCICLIYWFNDWLSNDAKLHYLYIVYLSILILSSYLFLILLVSYVSLISTLILPIYKLDWNEVLQGFQGWPFLLIWLDPRIFHNVRKTLFLAIYFFVVVDILLILA